MQNTTKPIRITTTAVTSLKVHLIQKTNNISNKNEQTDINLLIRAILNYVEIGAYQALDKYLHIVKLNSSHSEVDILSLYHYEPFIQQ